MVAAKRHQELLQAAIERDAEGQGALLSRELERARAAFTEAARLYRESWAQAPPRSYGRLVGMLKSAILAGDARAAADYVRAELGEADPESPTASYAQALAALVAVDDGAAETWAGRMHGGSDAFDRTAGASWCALSIASTPAEATTEAQHLARISLSYSEFLCTSHSPSPNYKNRPVPFWFFAGCHRWQTSYHPLSRIFVYGPASR